jgi:HCOMODA/2-hydroxy-3-carboxy-muconic semialdehyde decarboxylase
VPDGTAVFLERFIHAAIYAARPAVNAVVHSHSPAVIAFGVVPSTPLRPVCHTCGFMKTGVPVF